MDKVVIFPKRWLVTAIALIAMAGIGIAYGHHRGMQSIHLLLVGATSFVIGFAILRHSLERHEMITLLQYGAFLAMTVALFMFPTAISAFQDGSTDILSYTGPLLFALGVVSILVTSFQMQIAQLLHDRDHLEYLGRIRGVTSAGPRRQESVLGNMDFYSNPQGDWTS